MHLSSLGVQNFVYSSSEEKVGNMIRLWTNGHTDEVPDAVPQNPGHGITKDLKPSLFTIYGESDS